MTNDEIKKMFETIYLKENYAFDQMFWFNENYPFVILAKDYLSSDGDNRMYNLHNEFLFFKTGIKIGMEKK